MGEGTQTVEFREQCLWPGANSTSQARVDNSISVLGYRQIPISGYLSWLPELVIQLSAASALEVLKLWFPRVFCSAPKGECRAGGDGWEMAEAEGRGANLGV